MAPKKTAASEEVISSSDSPNNDEKVSGEAKSESSKVSAVARKTPIHPPTMVMVKEALKELDSRKGVSSQAIRSYVKEKYPSLDLVRLKYMIRKALNKGIENGVLVRPPNSTANGAQGRFRLAVRGKELKPKATENTKVKELKRKATENTDPNVEKAAKGGAKKNKEKEAVTKKITTAKKQNQKKTSEDAKSKNVAGGSKVAPAKKPKAKRPAEEGAAGDQPKPKALKTTKAGEGAAKKGEGAAKKGKASKKPAEGDGGDTVVPVARTTGKRGKKAAAE